MQIASELPAFPSQVQPSGNWEGILFPAPLGGERSLPVKEIQIRTPGMFLLGLVLAVTAAFVFPGVVFLGLHKAWEQ